MLLGVIMPAMYRGVLLAQGAFLVAYIGIPKGVRWIVRKIRV